MVSITRDDTLKDPLANLVSRAKRGDHQALAQLIARTQSRIYNLAYRFLGNVQEAEDLTQEVFIKVWRALPDFRGESKFTTWLYTIALNTFRNRRRAQRQPQTVSIDQEGLGEEILPAVEDPAQSVIANEERSRLWEIVECLPEKYRLVLTLFYQQQLSYQEIAKALSLPLGTVKAHLNRARRALAARLKSLKIL